MSRQSIELLEDAELECAFLPRFTLLEYCLCSVPEKQDASLMATLKRACACTVNDKISPRASRGEEEWNSDDIHSNNMDGLDFSTRYTSYDTSFMNDESRVSLDKRITTSTDLYSYNAGKRGVKSFMTRDTEASPSQDPYQSAINHDSMSSTSYDGSAGQGGSRSTRLESTWVAGNRKLGNPPILIYDHMT